MTYKNCPHYDGCSAQLCTMLSDDENRKCLWYPGEEICKLKRNLPDWVKQQKKIAAKIQPENLESYFNLDMLKVPFRVTKQVRGLDLNEDVEDEPKYLKAWFRIYKGTKPRKLTANARETKRQNMAKARAVKATKHKKAS